MGDISTSSSFVFFGNYSESNAGVCSGNDRRFVVGRIGVLQAITPMWYRLDFILKMRNQHFNIFFQQNRNRSMDIF